MGAKRIILGDNDLWKKTYSALLDIFCRGILKANNKKLIFGSIIAIVTTPTILPILLFKKMAHLIILLAIWFTLSQELGQYIVLEKIFIVLSLTAIFYRELYKEITGITLFTLIALSAGGFLRWLCRGYLNDSLLRQDYLTTIDVEPVIATLVPSLPDMYRTEYENIMGLYLDSNKPGNDEKLNSSIEKYWSAKNA